MSNIIHRQPFRNWVRGVLGLLYVQKGLYPLTDRVVKAEHARILKTLAPCSSCTVKEIKPAHASESACIYDDRNKAKCNCRKRATKVCKTCGQLYDMIITKHRFNNPLWVTDASIWYTNHWQMAKCFMTTTAQGSNNTAAETDAAGLLSIIINGTFFSQKYSAILTHHMYFLREMRNAILHNSTLELSDAEVTRYLLAMIAVLEDKKTLINDPSAQAAVKQLKEIVNDKLVVTTKDEARARQTALDAIKEATEQCEESIRTLTEDKTCLLQKQTLEAKQIIETAQETAVVAVTSAFEPEKKRLKLTLDDHDKAIEKKQSDLEEKLKHFEKQFDLLRSAQHKHQTRMDKLEQKQGTRISELSGNVSVEGPGRPDEKEHSNVIPDEFNSYEDVTAAIKKNGLETCNLIFGIDFTLSNKVQGQKTFEGRSIHAVSDHFLNPYQKVICILGETLGPLDEDGIIPVYGFGDSKSKDTSVFELRPGAPIKGFSEVLEVYNEVTPTIRLEGPTNFAPMIEKAIEIVKEKDEYHILVIVGDGQVSLQLPTKEAIVKASHFPLSIIVVGVGDGPWDVMKRFDDGLTERKFDNFQFVDFHEVQKDAKNPEAEFALHALMEIPEQYKCLKKEGLIK